MGISTPVFGGRLTSRPLSPDKLVEQEQEDDSGASKSRQRSYEINPVWIWLPQCPIFLTPARRDHAKDPNRQDYWHHYMLHGLPLQVDFIV